MTSASDLLDVDFDAEHRAAAVTHLLIGCGVAADAAWALEVGERLRALAALCERFGAVALSWALPCAARGCEEPIEVELPLAVLLDAVADGPVVVGGRTLRRPTGSDLLRWREHQPSDTEILATLGGPIEPTAAELAEAEAALAVADPLVDLQLQSACPACGEPVTLAVDLEADLLAQLRNDQERLIAQVAMLAGAFHWSEREILALPEARRRRYLALVA